MKTLLVIEHVEGTKRPGSLVTSQGLLQLGVRAGQWAAFLAPALGLLVFLLFPFKLAVTLYVLITGLAVALLKVIELRRLSFEIEEVLRRKLNGNYTH